MSPREDAPRARDRDAGVTAAAAVHRRPGDVRLAVALLLAIGASLLPMLRVVAAGPWVAAAASVVVAVLATGVLLRRTRVPAVVTSIAEVLVWVALVTLLYFGDTALLGIIPTPASFAELPAIGATLSEQILYGVAPLEAGRPLALLAVAGVGALAILLDHVVLTARMPLLAAIGLVAVWLIPSLAVPAAVDVLAFVLLAAAILLLLRAETASRERGLLRGASTSVPGARQDGPRPTSAVLAAGLAVVAIVATVSIAPELPRPVPRTGVGTGPATTINANLELGDDLRRPADVEVLTVRTNAAAYPYLRAATLSQFDGRVWTPDEGDTTPLTPEALGALVVGPDVRVTAYETTVAITQLTSNWLPIPGPAVDVTGLDGDWAAMPSNRTVVTAGGQTQGQDYTTTTHVARPTLEQIQAAGTTSQDLPAMLTAVPDDIPPSIGETARAITAGAENDFDALQALQRWFRGPDFSYSLDAPVQDGFDGSGAEAIADFLEVREGYCVHYASAFALMARTLGMPSRIVVGYLPGTSIGQSIDGQSVASVMSSQLHAWPEVYFAGIGWVQFEPTNSLGAPPTYSRSTVPVPDDGGEDVPPAPAPEPTASAAPAPSASATPTTAPDASGTGGEAVAWAGWPIVGGVAGGVLVLLIPAMVREIRRRAQLSAAARGDVMAAWRSVRESAVDVGMPLRASESPRVFGARLAAVPGVSDETVTSLVRRVEQVSFGLAGTAAGRAGGEAGAEAVVIRRALLGSVPPVRRAAALLAPRSLLGLGRR